VSINKWNTTAPAFAWTANADSVFVKVQRL
jgi:hypothetical protein